MYAWKKELLKNKITMWFLWAIVIATFVNAAFHCKEIPPPVPVIASKECKDTMKKHGITTLVIDHEKDEFYFIRDGAKIKIKAEECK